MKRKRIKLKRVSTVPICHQCHIKEKFGICFRHETMLMANRPITECYYYRYTGCDNR